MCVESPYGRCECVDGRLPNPKFEGSRETEPRYLKHEKCDGTGWLFDRKNWSKDTPLPIMDMLGNGKDEVYTEFYTCPRCGCNSIFKYFFFCPMCGQSIDTS